MIEPLSPELSLVDPDLAARARVALPSAPASAAGAPARPALPAPAATQPSAAEETRRHPYPMWARVTAAMWFVVVGILIGGAAIPHAQDTPRLIPKGEDVSTCVKPKTVAPLGPQVTQPGP